MFRCVLRELGRAKALPHSEHLYFWTQVLGVPESTEEWSEPAEVVRSKIGTGEEEVEPEDKMLVLSNSSISDEEPAC